MIASELIAKLQQLIETHGDKECTIEVAFGPVEDSDTMPVKDVAVCSDTDSFKVCEY